MTANEPTYDLSHLSDFVGQQVSLQLDNWVDRVGFDGEQMRYLLLDEILLGAEDGLRSAQNQVLFSLECSAQFVHQKVTDLSFQINESRRIYDGFCGASHDRQYHLTNDYQTLRVYKYLFVQNVEKHKNSLKTTTLMSHFLPCNSELCWFENNWRIFNMIQWKRSKTQGPIN